MTTPEFCRVYAQWFDLNRVHPSERREVVEWFCEKFGIGAEEAEEREDLAGWIRTYRRHRNFIVKLYESEFAEGTGSSTQSRSICRPAAFAAISAATPSG